MQRGVQVTQAFRNEIGKAVKTKRERLAAPARWCAIGLRRVKKRLA